MNPHKKVSVYPMLEAELALAEDTSKDDEAFQKLCKLPFWCYDNHLHERDENYRDRWCCLTHRVGLPQIRNQEMALADFQVEFCEKVVQLSKEKSKDLPLLMHINKGRQMGFTEIVLRLIQYFCLNRYAGRKVGIIAAVSGDLSRKDLRRLYRLYKEGIPEALAGQLVNNMIKLKNGTTIEAFPASEEAMTGDTNYGAIFMDEAAKWKILDDTPVFNSVMPIVRANASDLFLVSTPKGTVKTFYHIAEDDDSEFEKFLYPIDRALGSLHTPETIQRLIDAETEDPQQEYYCQFEGGKDAVFKITDQDRGDFEEIKLFENWSEDDSYVASDKEDYE